MNTSWTMVFALTVWVLIAAPADARRCKPDAVAVGPVCVDRHEASVWETTDEKTIKLIRNGKVKTPADLAAATPRGTLTDDFGSACPDTANGCTTVYAVSLAGVTSAGHPTWFQAAAACRNAGKRLATNQEWQMAALGTPDPGTDNDTTDCNVSFDPGLEPPLTGARSGCVSDTGAYDMVGNRMEWVADWGELASDCDNWSAAYGLDLTCIGGDGSSHQPGALIRGGFLASDSAAGVFFVASSFPPSYSNSNIGFRCAREP